MRLIGKVIRMFLAWTVFIFILGALFAALGGQRDHVGELACDGIFLLVVGFAVARWFGRRAARRDALAAQQLEEQHTAQQAQQSLATITVVIGDQQVPITITAGVNPQQIPLAADMPPSEEFPADPVVDDVPGLRGANLALATHAARDTGPGAIAVSYGGEVKAYVSRGGWQQVGEFADASPDDPVYRLVAVMATYAQNVLLGFEAEYTDADAMAYALSEFMPLELLERGLPNPEVTAAQFGLPADALRPDNLQGLSTAIARRNDSEARARRAAGADLL